jgi:hypothetical protein
VAAGRGAQAMPPVAKGWKMWPLPAENRFRPALYRQTGTAERKENADQNVMVL